MKARVSHLFSQERCLCSLRIKSHVDMGQNKSEFRNLQFLDDGSHLSVVCHLTLLVSLLLAVRYSKACPVATEDP